MQGYNSDKSETVSLLVGEGAAPDPRPYLVATFITVGYPPTHHHPLLGVMVAGWRASVVAVSIFPSRHFALLPHRYFPVYVPVCGNNSRSSGTRTGIEIGIAIGTGVGIAIGEGLRPCAPPDVGVDSRQPLQVPLQPFPKAAQPRLNP